jgi:hypothetical protein
MLRQVRKLNAEICMAESLLLRGDLRGVLQLTEIYRNRKTPSSPLRFAPGGNAAV